MSFLLFLETLALTGGIVHSFVEGEPPRPATVLVQEGKIAAIGADVAIPEGARRIDVTGLHLIPGLIDGMVNHDPDHDRLYVSAGVTLVRDVGNDLTTVLAERRPPARERGPGPAIFTAGAVLDGLPPSTTAAVVLGSPEEADAKLPRFFEFDLDFVSLQARLSEPTWKKVLELAHGKELAVWGPVTPAVSLSAIVGAKQDGLFHLEGFLPQGIGWDRADLEMLQPSIDVVASSELAITPALCVYAQRLVAKNKDDAPELAYLGPLYHQIWLAELEVRRKLVNEEFLATGLRIHKLQGELVKQLFDRGVTLVPGSASPNAWLFPGRALVDELGLWVRAGIPPSAVLRSATAGAARELGAADRGTLEVGKIADLCVLRADPEADIKALRDPEWVVLRGRAFDRASLDALTQSLADEQKKIREAAGKPLEVAPPELPPGEVLLSGSVETRAPSGRVSGERFAVVARPEGALTYCGRMLTPGSASTHATLVSISQTIAGDDLTEFAVDIQTGPRTITIRGAQAAGRMMIERRIDGKFVDNLPVKERLAFVDIGSVTGHLVLGHHARPGELRVLFFEDFEPALGNWEMRLDADGTHLVRTHNGDMKVRYEASGAPSLARRVQGNVIVETRPIEKPAGKGLALPAEKRGRDAR